MRKYTKAVFCLLFFISFIGLLIYRTEYLRLRYTFEVGGLLDPPELPNNCLVLNKSVLSRFDEFNLFSRPRQLWNVINEYFVYSSFMRTTEDSRTAVALAIGDSKNHCFKYKCHIWFNQRGNKFSLDGTFSCESFNVDNSGKLLLEFYCKIKESDVKGSPYMLNIIDEADQRHLVPLVKKSGKVAATKKSTLCVYPDAEGLEQLQVIEFLSYHLLIGFTDIIVYDNFVHHEIFSNLELVFQNSNLLRSFSVLQWNFPVNDVALSHEVIKRDCVYRTNSHVKLIAFLNFNEYLIPVRSKYILDASSKFSEDKTSMFHLNIRKCCTDSKDDKKSDKSWPLIFKKTNCVPQAQNSVLFVNSLGENFPSAVTLPSSDLYVNLYDPCNPSSNLGVRDTTTLKYLTSLMESKLLALWRSGTLYE